MDGIWFGQAAIRVMTMDEARQLFSVLDVRERLIAKLSVDSTDRAFTGASSSCGTFFEEPIQSQSR